MNTTHNDSHMFVETSNTSPLGSTIETKLEDTRRRLLDLTRRNRLLNHRTVGRATLRIVDELPSEIFRLLVADNQTLQFLAREEAPRESAAIIAATAREDEGILVTDEGVFSLAPIDRVETSSRHSDKNLQTALNGDQLQGRLLYLARQAESAREEQGCNILYLALGFVEWREKPTDPPSRAPLIFIPADLQRRTVKSRHNLQRFEDDILINPCLIELCRRIFRFELPTIEIDEALDINKYFEQIEGALNDLPGWRFLPEMHLGLFSFAKLLMYRDLDPATWPPQRQLAGHALIRRLSGFEAPLPDDELVMPRAETLDDTVSPNNSFQVVDADSSQQVAIQAVKQGLSTVIEGPPGTGKSQTITNIIAECLAAGKTVLFVAEKAAALSVVKRRLETAGLGDHVLELHSNKTSKRLVLDELQRTLTTCEEAFVVGKSDSGILEQSRDRLNDYARSLHTPLGALELSPYEIIGRYLAVQNAPEAYIALDDPLTWDAAQVRVAHEYIEAFDLWRARVGDTTTHPWNRLALQRTDTLTRQRMQRALEQVLERFYSLRESIRHIATMLQLPLPQSRESAETLVKSLQALLELSDLAPGMVADTRWETCAAEIEGWITSGLERMQHKQVWTSSFIVEAERYEWGDILERRRVHEQSIMHTTLPTGLEDRLMRWVSSGWKTDAQQIEAHLIPGTTLTAQQQFEQLRIVVASATLRNQLLEGVKKYAEIFRTHWEHIDGDWDHLRKSMDTALAARQMVVAGVFGQQAAERVLERGERALFAQQLASLQEATTQVEEALTTWYSTAETSESAWLGDPWRSIAFDSFIARHETLLNAFEELEVWTQYRHAQAQLETLLPAFLEWSLLQPTDSSTPLTDCFDRQFYQLWLDEALRQRPALATFRGEEHEALLQRFATHDERWIETNQRRVAGLVRSRIPDLGRESHRQSKLGILRGEIRKKRRNMALRKLFAQTGEALQALKPCFMMSPISIAQYLAPGTIEFDVVIFDEASQVEPADAYGAIARGRQLILVGDEKQLPPTNFFNKFESDEPNTDDEDLAATDLESVLSLGVVRLPHQCALRWHYRSRHSSLIEFSNQQFYDGKLRVFPGPYVDTSAFGLQFQYVADGVYMRGAGQYNPKEARAVAAAAIQHALITPHLTLGIGAFSVAQQRAIEDEIEHKRRESTDPRIEAFFAGQSHEPFFVKNLETIQGDERDVILLSVGYGPDQQGKVRMNFGPLNRDGGWRRLNVLITRARQRCVLFSSIRSDHINVNATRARGVIALKSYLHLAEHGHVFNSSQRGSWEAHALTPLVAETLRSRGWQVHEQVGTVGSFVDLAIVDTNTPGRYLAGIDIDGERYGAAATARDRERLRLQVLSRLGWNVHRVWSMDWYRRPRSAVQHLLDQLDHDQSQETPTSTSTVVEEPLSDSSNDTVDETSSNHINTTSAADSLVMPYRLSSFRTIRHPQGIDFINVLQLSAMINQIVDEEGPIHEEEVQRIIATYCTTRASKRIQQMCERAINYALSNATFHRRESFLWPLDVDTVSVRSRSDPCPVTKAELIAPEEIQAAVRLVLEQQFGLQRDALIISTARLMGFRRCGAALEKAIDTAVDELLLSEQTLVDHQGFITLRNA